MSNKNHLSKKERELRQEKQGKRVLVILSVCLLVLAVIVIIAQTI